MTLQPCIGDWTVVDRRGTGHLVILGAMTTLSREELIRYASHVRYEKDMWEWAIDQLGPDVAQGGFHNAMVEVFILHSRALVEFFRSIPREDDVIATNYVPDWKYDEDLTAMVGTLQSMNKRWGHLSAYRLDNESRERDLEEWRVNTFRMRSTWARFERQLDPEMANAFQDGTAAP